MREIAVDLADDRFDITYNPELASPASLLKTIRNLDLDYQPEIVDAPTQHVDCAESIDPASLPPDLQELFAEAKAKDKPVIVEFSGPG